MRKFPWKFGKQFSKKSTGVFERGWRLNYYKLRIVG
jgi:hypothetical protein